MWFFMALILIPLIDLTSFGVGVSTTMFLSTWGARNAAPCATFTEALASLAKTEAQLQVFRGFSRMTPNGPGAKPYIMKVLVTPISTGGAGTSYTTPGGIPNQPPPDPMNPAVPPMNTVNSVYQYVVTAKYLVAPLISFGPTSMFKDIPGLGKPVPIEFTTTATVEHPEGLNQ
jgi:hypothetical protein